MWFSARWSEVNQLAGWTVCRDFHESLKQAHLKRNPRHDNYIPVWECLKLTDAESEAYGILNDKLHEQIRSVCQEHFQNTAIPKSIQKNETYLHSYYTPFTYQNEDWYGPSFECYVTVVTRYISATLLSKFQSLLHGDLHDWCICVVAGNNQLEEEHNLAVFSEQVLVPFTAARAMRAPKWPLV